MKKLAISILAFGLFSSSAFADKARFLYDDKEALQARVDLIQQAEKEILVEYFSVWNDDQSVGGISLLIEAAKRGVQVKVILDALSNTVPPALFSALQTKGIDKDGKNNLEVKVYNSFNIFTLSHRDHSKMLIVDGKRIISGGRNVGDKYFGLSKKRNYRDLDIMIEGEVVKKAHKNFLTVWDTKMVTPPQLHQFSADKIAENACFNREDFDACELQRKSALITINKEQERLNKKLGEILSSDSGAGIVKSNTQTDWMLGAVDIKDIQFLSQDPTEFTTKEVDVMTKDLLAQLATTEKEITIVSPYLIPKPILFAGFKVLTDRGVKINFITNSIRSTDNLFAQAAYRKHRLELISAGIELYEYNGPSTLHAKTAVIDKNKAIIGTFNVDPRSAYINREVGFIITEDENNHPLTNLLKSDIELIKEDTTQVGHNGQAMNLENDDHDVDGKKLMLLKAITFLLPLIENML